MHPASLWRVNNRDKARENSRKRYARVHRFLNKLKQSGCVDCHKLYPSYVLEFDHREPKEKKFCLSQGGNKSWKAIYEEVKKCDVVCGNCHNLRTWTRRLEEKFVLIVEISVNDELIGKETAVRISGTASPDSLNTYRLSDGSLITHLYGDGAAKLAEKMMSHLAKSKGI